MCRSTLFSSLRRGASEWYRCHLLMRAYKYKRGTPVFQCISYISLEFIAFFFCATARSLLGVTRCSDTQRRTNATCTAIRPDVETRTRGPSGRQYYYCIVVALVVANCVDGMTRNAIALFFCERLLTVAKRGGSSRYQAAAIAMEKQAASGCVGVVRDMLLC